MREGETIKNKEHIRQGIHIDLDTYLDAYLRLPLFTKERLEASANLIKIISSTISSFEETKNLYTENLKERKNITK
jgi:hypothetical protein